jgi:hypothetical protein
VKNEEEIPGRGDVLVGRCLPYDEGITYWSLRKIFAAAGAEDELKALDGLVGLGRFLRGTWY